MIGIAICEERPLVLLGLVQAIGSDPAIKLLGSAAAPADLLAILELRVCDLVLLGVSHPDRNALPLVREIKARHSRVRVLVLCMFPWQEAAATAFRAGASGCITDMSSPEEVLTAIHTVAEGNPYISPSTADAVVSALRRPDAAREPELSPRQLQVLRLYASGSTISEIAERTGLSVRTVSTYKARILEKLQFSSNADLIAFAIRNSLR